jgi:hypothetical protein
MKNRGVLNHRVPVACALLFCLQIAPALAGGPLADDDRRDPRNIELTFTKWITIAPGYPQMEGFVESDAIGSFTGEVLVAQTTSDGGITRVEAVYEIHAGPRSFTALVQGGQNNQTGEARLDGTILGGWRTGDRVHVQYDVVGCSQPNALGHICFQGTIRIE